MGSFGSRVVRRDGAHEERPNEEDKPSGPLGARLISDDYDSCVLVRTPLRAATDGVVARQGQAVYGP